METNRSALEGLPVVAGAIAGLLAWVLGYAFTYLIAAEDARESGLQQFLEAINDEPATYELVGWIFYNAHFVDVVFENVPIVGSWSENYVGGEDGLTALLYVVPVGLLLAAGLAVARTHGATDSNEGLLAGLLVLPSYLLLSIAGVFLFEVTVGSASGAPDLLPAVLLSGVLFPAVFASVGGAVAGLTASGS